MTVCVGLIEEGRTGVWLGVDSMVTAGWTKHVMGTSKIVAAGEYLAIAVTGNLSSLTALQHWMDVPRYVPGDSQERWVARELWPAMVEAHRAGGYIGEDEREIEAQFLVALDGHLFVVSGDGAVLEPSTAFAAVGSGGETAFGALVQSAARKKGYEKRVVDALEAAQLGSVYVDAPYGVLRVPVSGR